MTKISNLIATLQFGKPFTKTLLGRSAKVIARSAIPHGEFWEVYRKMNSKERVELKEAGISVAPIRGKWNVLQFQRNGEFVS